MQMPRADKSRHPRHLEKVIWMSRVLFRCSSVTVIGPLLHFDIEASRIFLWEKSAPTVWFWHSLVDTIHMFSYGFNVLSSLSSLCKPSIYLSMMTSSEELLTFSPMWGVTVLPRSEVRLRQNDTCQKSSTARLCQVVSYLTHILRSEKKKQKTSP